MKSVTTKSKKNKKNYDDSDTFDFYPSEKMLHNLYLSIKGEPNETLFLSVGETDHNIYNSSVFL